MLLSDGKTKRAEEFLTNFLIKTYPKCFNLNNKIPLKVGIQKEVILNHPKWNKRLIKNAFSIYCDSIDYLENFPKYNGRIDLNGEKVEVFKEGAIEDSLKRINEYRKLEEVNSERIKKGLSKIRRFNDIDKTLKLKKVEEAKKVKEAKKEEARKVEEAKKVKNKRPILTLKRK